MRTTLVSAVVLATAAALVGTVPSSAVATQTSRGVRSEVIATFGTGHSFAESATLDAHGHAVVSVNDWGEEQPDGTWTDNVGHLRVLGKGGIIGSFGPAVPLGGCSMILGVDMDSHGNAVVALFNFAGNDTSCSPWKSGLLKVTRTSVTQLSVLPGDWSWPNGVEVVGRHAFVTDSLNGSIYRVPTNRTSSPKAPWFASSLLDPLEDPDLALGANGVVYRNGTLFVTSYGQGKVLAVQVRANGRSGAVRVVADDPLLVAADGITIDRRGTLWVTVTHRMLTDGTKDAGHVVTVSPHGRVADVRFAEGQLDYPTQALFVGREKLLVLSGSYDVEQPYATLFRR